MKISFITTVLNEEKSVINLLGSLNSQTVLPDEVIIADGGSTDKTLSVISNFKFQISNKIIKFKILSKTGNRAVGRNAAIGESSGEIIVCTDAGCILDKNWIKNITAPFKSGNVDVASGFYVPRTKGVFQKALAGYTSVMPDKLDPQNFLPSSRSIAFKKDAWRKIGGYPEWLNTCEDLYFARELQKKRFVFKTVKDAIVFWPQRKNFTEAFIQFYNYALGDGTARYFRKTTPFLYTRYALGIVLLMLAFLTKSVLPTYALGLLFVLYLLWSIQKNYKYVNHPQAILILPALQLVSDVAVLSGTTIGILKSYLVKR